jgi:endonuclease III
MESEEVSPQLIQQALAIHQRLLGYFHEPHWGNPSPPLDELISTILSQNTNDKNRDVAFTQLKASFPTWEAVRDAPAEDVIQAIRSAGLANQKGPRIQAVLRQISAERHNLDLEFLRLLPRSEAQAWLQRFKGVGPKTTAIVLLFSLGIPAFPVDTHIYRVTGRLGLRPAAMTVEAAHARMEILFPPEAYAPAHLNLIHLGRELCHPRHPECQSCPVGDICQYNKTRGNDGIFE